MRNNNLYHAAFAKFVCYMFFAFGLIALACKAYGFFVWLSTPLLVMFIFRMFDLEFTTEKLAYNSKNSDDIFNSVNIQHSREDDTVTSPAYSYLLGNIYHSNHEDSRDLFH